MKRLILAAIVALMGMTWMGSVADAQGYFDEMAAACQVYGCDPNYLYGVMLCESEGDPNAVGPHGELGIFQIDPRYWGYMSSTQQIWFAAQHLTAGDVYWVCG